MFARETKKVSLGDFIPYCNKFVLQILLVQTFNQSAKTLLKKLPSRIVSIKHTKRLKDFFYFHCNIFLRINLLKNQNLLKQYQNLVQRIS